ncbi:SPOR domain-containing protein [Marinomonas shanghaiensis]|jgi:DedD protein|uniref:SPOR domain-containing protein n=1 Tax=Marinomonas shanghaiensis TaxID=2202418 RepID=UPI001E485839|nr:SPOR domain-containing protein [Marinomonas shanghaiensis]
MIDRTITYRLIGAGIMVLSAAIILPLILDGERPAELDMQVQVTAPPAFQPLEIAAVQPVERLPVEPFVEEDAAVDDIQLIPVAPASNDIEMLEQTTPAAPTPTPQAASVPVSTPVKQEVKTPVEKVAPAAVGERWTLQIATFKSKENAVRLVEKLKEGNYAAYSLTTNALYKVYVGPELKRETSEKMREEIKQKFSLTGFVTKYSVN